MTPTTSPVVAGWELALWLRQRREQLRLDAATVAESIGVTRNYWSAIENERKLPSEENLASATVVLGFEPEEYEELIALRTAAREPGWWTNYPVVNDKVRRYYGLEAGARGVRGFESLIFPGLLQTEEYARRIIADAAMVPEVEVDQYVEVRMRRQARLTGEMPLHATYLISEAALLQQIGGPDTLRRQLQHVIDMLEEHPDSINVHVIPFTVKSCDLFGSSTFNVLEFASPRLPVIAWQETVTALGTIENRIQLRDITKIFNASLRLALNRQESIGLIHHYRGR